MRRKKSNQETMRTFKDWPLLDEMPDGWRLCGDVGSPLAGYVFIHNGKSVINGQQRALLRDIRADLAVCEIEGWSKTEYINQLKASIDQIARGI
jgi:hypothetical protein